MLVTRARRCTLTRSHGSGGSTSVYSSLLHSSRRRPSSATANGAEAYRARGTNREAVRLHDPPHRDEADPRLHRRPVPVVEPCDRPGHTHEGGRVNTLGID